MEPWAAVVTGFIAGLLYISSSRTLVSLRLDDAVDAIPIHGFNGIWGAIAVGLFANPDRVEDTFGIANNPGLLQSLIIPGVEISGKLLGAQIVGILAVFAWIITHRCWLFETRPVSFRLSADESNFFTVGQDDNSSHQRSNQRRCSYDSWEWSWGCRWGCCRWGSSLSSLG